MRWSHGHLIFIMGFPITRKIWSQAFEYNRDWDGILFWTIEMDIVLQENRWLYLGDTMLWCWQGGEGVIPPPCVWSHSKSGSDLHKLNPCHAELIWGGDIRIYLHFALLLNIEMHVSLNHLPRTPWFFIFSAWFLAATKQLYEWFSPSVCPSVTPFSLCSHYRIIMKFSGVITNDRSDIHAKGQGQRSKVKVTQVNTQLSRFRTITPVWMHIWWWNDAQSLMLLRRGAL